MTDKPQVDKFKEVARALGCDDDDAALDRALDRLDLTRTNDAKPEPKKPADK